jgi:hypothetical protein
MKHSTWVLACWLAILSGAAMAKSPDEKLEYDAARPLISLHMGSGRQYALADLDQVLRQTVEGSAQRTPIVVYVHGRGNEPRKSFADTTFTKGYVLAKIERYGVRVVGFNWNSKIRPLHFCDRPVDRAAESAGAFVTLVGALRDHRAHNQEFWTDRPLVLLVHSMGSFVVRAAVLGGQLPDDEVFDRVLITSSDAAADQATWLSAKALGRERFVFSNPDDEVLRKSQKCEDKELRAKWQEDVKTRKQQKLPPLPFVGAAGRLGRLSLPIAQAIALPSVFYVQIPAGDIHRYFTASGQRWNPNVCQVIQSAMRGATVVLSPSWRAGEGLSQYVIPVKSAKDDPCFGGVSQVDDDKE